MGSGGLLVFPCRLERSGYGQRVGFSDAKVGGEDAHSRHSPKAAPAPPASCRRERKQSGARKTNLRNATIPGNLITGPARTAIGSGNALRDRERGFKDIEHSQTTTNLLRGRSAGAFGSRMTSAKTLSGNRKKRLAKIQLFTIYTLMSEARRAINENDHEVEFSMAIPMSF